MKRNVAAAVVLVFLALALSVAAGHLALSETPLGKLGAVTAFVGSFIALFSAPAILSGGRK